VPDGDEPSPGDDTDGDGLINALDPDSDGDGLFDGTELGLDCSDPATDEAAGNCISDADGGDTTTDPLDDDTDDGGVTDGDEDLNHNGVIDGGETDPNDGSDDVPVTQCEDDSDCDTGEVCDSLNLVCIDGCRGVGGNGCPTGEECTSTDESVGDCVPTEEPVAEEGYYAEGGGLFCAASPAESGKSAWLVLGLAAAAAVMRRRRKAAA